MNCKPGDLAIVVAVDMPDELPMLGKIIQVTSLDPDWNEAAWFFAEGQIQLNCFTCCVTVPDRVLRPLRSEPGNEEFVTKARKTLQRAKPVTGPVTINVRGEPA